MAVTSVLLSLLLSASTAATRDMGHYIDGAGDTISSLEPVWAPLHSYWGDDLPIRISVDVKAIFGGMYDCQTSQIVLKRSRFEQQPLFTAAHESTHLALCSLTKLANTMGPFRFIDEGTATIREYRVGGSEASLRQQAYKYARLELANDRIKFAVVQDWRHYFGDPATDPQHLNFNAYLVSATFCYALIDAIGDDRYKEFLVELGLRGDLEGALSAVAGMTLDDARDVWVRSIQSSQPEG